MLAYNTQQTVILLSTLTMEVSGESFHCVSGQHVWSVWQSCNVNMQWIFHFFLQATIMLYIIISIISLIVSPWNITERYPYGIP